MLLFLWFGLASDQPRSSGELCAKQDREAAGGEACGNGAGLGSFPPEIQVRSSSEQAARAELGRELAAAA